MPNMRNTLILWFLLSLAGAAISQEVFVPMRSVDVTRGSGNELTDKYQWEEGGTPFVLHASGTLESETGKRLTVVLSKGNHVYNLWAGHFNGNLVLSYIDYSGGFGVDRLCLVAIAKHELKWCKRVSSQVVKGYRAALPTGFPVEKQYKVKEGLHNPRHGVS